MKIDFGLNEEKDLKGVLQLCGGAYTGEGAEVRLTEASLFRLCKSS